MTREEYVIASMMIEPDSFDYCLKKLKSTDFTNTALQQIFKYAGLCKFEKTPFDKSTLGIKFHDQPELIDLIGNITKSYIIENTTHWRLYADQIISERQNKDLWSDIDKLKGSNSSFDDVLNTLQTITARAKAERPIDENNLGFITVTPESFIKMEEAAANNGDCIPSGYEKFDNFTNGGFQREQLYSIGACAKVGKTSFALQMAVNVASAGFHVLYFSFEMTVRNLAERITSMNTNIPVKQLRELSDDSIYSANIWDALKNLKFMTDKTLTIDDVIAKCEAYKRVTGHLDLVIIDFLHAMPFSAAERKNDRHDALGNIVKDFAAYLRNSKAAGLLLCQLNPKTASDERPHLCDMRETSGIEIYSDLSAILARPEKSNKSTLYIDSTRYCGVGSISLTFTPEICLFQEADV